MPDVGIVLDGHEFVLSPFDYTYEWPVKGGGVRCVAAFEGHEARDAKEVVLGTSFLRGFYSVFDLDAQTVGCKWKYDSPFEFKQLLEHC